MIKKGILALMALLMVTLSAQAQRGQRNATPEQRAKHMEKMVADLGLDETTAASYKTIEENFYNKTQEIRKEDTDRKAKREKLKTLRAEMDEQVKEIFTDEQYEKYQELRKKRRKRGRGGEGRKKKEDGR